MRAFLVILLLVVTLPLGADAPDQVSLRPWIELEPLLRIGPGPYPIPRKTAEQALLERARVLVSAMVYGWTFSYEPGDRARQVSERFTLTPVAQVVWGNPRLRVTETELDGTRLWARFVYRLDPDESRWRESWSSGTADLSTGQGTAPIQLGDEGRTRSLEAAVRDAIRRSLDIRVVNKPRRILGEVLLWEDPRVVVRSGEWVTTATVKLLVRDLVPYRIF